MKNLNAKGAPPPGFLEIRKGGVVVWVKEAFASLFDESGSWRMDQSSHTSSQDVSRTGRGAMTRVSLGMEGKAHGLIRHYQRGGAIRHLLGDRYLGSERFFNEVRTAEEARAAGVSTSEVLALRTEKQGCDFYRADLMTLEIQGALDLDGHLCSVRDKAESIDVAKKREALVCVANVLHDMHRAGMFHADLNMKNILLEFAPTGARAYVIDLDRARFFRPLSRQRRVNNLRRLYRSLEKLGHMGKGITDRDLLLFVGAYCRDDREMDGVLKERLRKRPLSLKARRFFWDLKRRA